MLLTLLLSGIGGDLNVQISQAAYDMTRNVIVLLVSSVVPIMMTITLVTTIGRGYLSGQSLQIDLAPLFKILFIAGFLLSYRTLMPKVGDSIYWISRAVTGNGAQAQAYATLESLKPQPPGAPAPPTPGSVANGTQDQPSVISGLANEIASIAGSISGFSMRQWLLELATGTIAQLIQVCMLFIQAFLAGFLFVVGPIAFTLSMLPGWGGLMKSWFQSFLSVNLWTVTFAIINKLFAQYSAAMAALAASKITTVDQYFAAYASDGQYQVACIIFIVMYLMVPYMTSLIVGSSAAQSFVGAAAGLVASRAAMGAGKAVGSAVGAAGNGVSTMAGAMANDLRGAGGAINTAMGGFGGFGGGGGGAAAGAAAGSASMGVAPMMPGAGAVSGSARTANSYANAGYSPPLAALGAPSSSPGGSAGAWGAAAPSNPGAPNHIVNLGSSNTLRGTAFGTGQVGAAPPSAGAGSSAQAALPAPPTLSAPSSTGGNRSQGGSDDGTGAVDVTSGPGGGKPQPPTMIAPGLGHSGSGGSF
ncbi:hypothetical protein LRS06_21600 [Hymenobacter sp. J193]|uniref:hypothetical protein n=1 Tax=Hymenobacter sp. J193 TaxID=2898429 RepID=UPI0021510720|nr:hypothetical protein [Hymenobacter sp. J193]MCR5890325.1 hypothetical protein [Hymenobacter sp. J193]